MYSITQLYYRKYCNDSFVFTVEDGKAILKCLYRPIFNIEFLSPNIK